MGNQAFMFMSAAGYLLVIAMFYWRYIGPGVEKVNEPRDKVFQYGYGYYWRSASSFMWDT